MSGADRGNMITPNMLSVCVDGTENGEIRGCMYCCYEKKAFPFLNEHTLIRGMGRFMDILNYPQSSVDFRSYHPGGRGTMQRLREPHSPGEEEVKELLKHRGAVATLLVYVRYRQNATWQGTVVHRESGRREDFYSELEFLKIIDRMAGRTADNAIAAWTDRCI